jgi:hypothetical protein
MKKSATEVMQEIVFAAVVDGIVALKAASKGVPNTLLRDLNALHANTTQADLPPELQAAIAASVRGAFARLLKEGYSVSPAGSAPPPRPPRPEGQRSGERPPRGRGPAGKPRREGGAGDERRPPRPGGGRPGGGRPGGRPGGRGGPQGR